ncbi:DUF4145 domain-containing protein [Pseudomonas asplenii]|uniref:DUF4145 domain-containing protein n=1 Tax=Pseudomonas asplenii TaxID=53407 RepID=UPI0023601CA1|nr:DUF4145 domain-containing protein [Pseudomonas asplenii]
MTALFKKRFLELADQLEHLQTSVVIRHNPFGGGNVEDLDPDALLNWGVKVKSLFERLGTQASSHLQEFIDKEKPIMMESTGSRLRRMRAVFLATKEDFEGGYLAYYRNIVQAEVFSSELEQAEELLNNGYQTAAAVIAGVVLETALRDLCTTHGIEHGTLSRMNDELAKAGVYNANQKKQITSLSAIRNSAAHGKPEEFTADHVRGMINDVQRFLVAQQ